LELIDWYNDFISMKFHFTQKNFIFGKSAKSVLETSFQNFCKYGKWDLEKLYNNYTHKQYLSLLLTNMCEREKTSVRFLLSTAAEENYSKWKSYLSNTYYWFSTNLTTIKNSKLSYLELYKKKEIHFHTVALLYKYFNPEVIIDKAFKLKLEKYSMLCLLDEELIKRIINENIK